MKNITLVLLGVTFFMVGTAFAAPTIDMYELEEEDCRVCHDSASVLKNTNHGTQHNSEFDSCLDCHVKGPKKLDCMKSGCHAEGDIGVTNHHDFDEMGIDNNCFACHEKGEPRGR